MTRSYECVFITVIYLLSDACLFYVLQGFVLLVILIAWFQNWKEVRRARCGSATLSVERGIESMGHFYTMYGAISGLLIAISLSVDVAKDYRVFWALFDTVLVAYVCLYNPWFRNVLLGWAARLAKLEKR